MNLCPVVGAYSAEVARVIDGDSVVVDLELLPPAVQQLGLRVDVRLVRCNTRELDEPGGREAREYLAARLPAGRRVVLSGLRRDARPGRIVAEVWLPDGTNLTNELIAGGWAAPWTGRGPKPLPAWPRPEDVSALT